MAKKLNLQSPWIIFCHEMEAMFKNDPEVEVVHSEDGKDIKLYVENAEKACALTELLPMEKKFGNVTVTITVIPANIVKETKASLFEKAFEGNPAFAYLHEVEPSIISFGASYVVFKKEVVQYPNDSLADAHGVCSTLYQEIAKDIFEEHDGIYFCTDTEGKVGELIGTEKK